MTENIPCYPDSLVYHPGTSSVKTCTLNQDARVQGVRFPAGSILGFDRDGRLWRCHISEETMIRGIACKARSEVEFFPQGGPAMLTPSGNFEVDGMPLAGGCLTLFHENGRLFRGVLAGDVILGGCKLKSATEATFYDNGNLASFELLKDLEIKKLPLAGGSRVWLYESGGLRGGTIREDRIISGIPCAGGFPVWFHDNGKLAGCSLYRDMSLPGRGKAARGDIILLDEIGNLRDVLIRESPDDFPSDV